MSFLNKQILNLTFKQKKNLNFHSIETVHGLKYCQMNFFLLCSTILPVRNKLIFHSYNCRGWLHSSSLNRTNSRALFQVYCFVNDITNVDNKMPNCLWFVGITLFFNGVPQKTVQRCFGNCQLPIPMSPFRLINGHQTLNAINRLWHRMFGKLRQSAETKQRSHQYH